jgi:GPH family glycoside/pentoside/hexuronide:cation symporter
VQPLIDDIARPPALRLSLWPLGLAHFGKSLFWHSSELVFAFFLTERAGMPAAWMGAVLAGGLALSALIDLVVGRQLRGGGFTLARACRLQLVGAWASAAAITPLFAAELLPEAWRLAWTTLLAIAFRVAYALYDIPQNATLSLATRDGEERARLAALRLFFSGLASIVVAATLAWLVRAGPGRNNGSFALAGLAMSAFAIGSAWHLTRIGPRTVSMNVTAAPTPPAIRNTGLAPLLLLMFVLSAAASAFGKLEPYYVTYRWHGQGGAILIAASLGFALGQPLWLGAIRRAGFFLSLCAATAMLPVAAFGFVLSGAAGYYLQAAFAFAFGAANGGISIALWARFADAVSARRSADTAFAFAQLTAASKSGLAAASLAIAAWLALADYRTGGAGLDAAMAGFPMAGAVASLTILALASRRDRKRPGIS